MHAGAHPAGVVGDGTTTRSRATSRWRRLRVPLALVATLVAIGLLAALPEPRTSTTPLAPDNPGPAGARAVAQVLGRHGVDVRYTRRFADVVAADASGVTVAVLGEASLTDAQVSALRDLESDLVLVAAPWAAEQVAGIRGGAGTSDDDRRPARCDDPDALAAGAVQTAGSLVAGPGQVACFPVWGAPDSSGGAYVVAQVDGRRVAALGSGDLLMNDRVDRAGNAALALRVLGRGEQLVWYIPSWDDPWDGTAPDDEGLASTMPPWTEPLLWMLALVVVVAGVWRGRRFGRLVVEPLPVVVRAGETTRGRGRLYRRGRAHGHAAAALRAATASRCAARLGLPRSAAAPDVIDAVARATGRDAAVVEDLLYGPPPTTDSALARLAGRLDHLESEVHRS
ncbi:DUF4350 domain-containing protein [Cellulomonas palmilytica]|nr:DUF4350 domain-containing protein [Cellulomonas palmilytica]